MLIEIHFDRFADIHRILIVQLGDIGDVIWTVPTLLSVAAAYPQARLSVLVHETFGDILQAEPYIEKIFEVPKSSGDTLDQVKTQVRLVSALRREHFDLAVDLRAGDRGAVLTRLSGAKIRAALSVQDASLLRNRMFTHLVQPVNENIRMSYGAAEQSLRVVRGLGIETNTDIPVLHVQEQAKSTVGRLLGASGLTPERAFVTINPFSRWSYKEWGPGKWVEVMTWLSEALGLWVAVVGSPGERPKAAELVDACPEKIVNLAGKTNLTELAALLNMSRLHVGVDSAAPHIAAAVGTPTVTIYGPTDWRDWAPVGEQHRVVVSQMNCIPCHQNGCNGQGRSLCLEDLSSDSVKEAIISAVSPLQAT